MLFNLGLISIFMVRNIIYLTLEVKDIISLVNVITLVERSSVIYIINLVLLVLGEYINMVTS
jgi:hypothetical protein